MDCYVEAGYWDDGYTEQDVCGIAPPPVGGGGGGAGIIYLRPKYIDKNGREVSSPDVWRKVKKAAPALVKQEVVEAVERLEEAQVRAVDFTALDAMSADLQRLMAMIPQAQMALNNALGYELARIEAILADERDVETLLLLM